MDTEAVIATTLLTNLPTLLVVVIAIYVLRKKRRTGLFVIGLLLVLASGLFAVPVSDWAWSNHEVFMAESTKGTSLIVTAFGVIHGAGLLCLVFAYATEGPRDA